MSTIDPVCGKELNRGDIAASAPYGVLLYQFCSEECREAFDADPTRYVSHDPGADVLVGTTEDSHEVPQNWRDPGDLEGRPPGT